MSDDKAKRDYRDRDRINLNEPYEVEYWTKELGVSAEQLKKLVAEHGVMVSNIRVALKK